VAINQLRLAYKVWQNSAHQNPSPGTDLNAAAPDLLEALHRAVATIRAFHGIGLNDADEAAMWKLYQASPEMQAINAAIAKAEGR
jgi:hypothetical protein